MTFFGGGNIGFTRTLQNLYEAPVYLSYEYNAQTDDYYLVYKQAKRKKDMTLLATDQRYFLNADVFIGMEFYRLSNWRFIGSLHGTLHYYPDFEYNVFASELSAGVRYIF